MNHQFPSILNGGHTSLPVAATLISLLAVIMMDVVLIFYCLDDLNRRASISGDDRRMWTRAIILGGPLGQAAYWMYGRGPY